MMIEYTCLHEQQWCMCWWLNPIQSLFKSVRHCRGRQGKGISMSTMQKGAILPKCLNTFVPHCLNAKLWYCTQVEQCMTMIWPEFEGINDIIMLLVVGWYWLIHDRIIGPIRITWWRNKRALISRINVDMVYKLKTDAETRAHVHLLVNFKGMRAENIFNKVNISCLHFIRLLRRKQSRIG